MIRRFTHCLRHFSSSFMRFSLFPQGNCPQRQAEPWVPDKAWDGMYQCLNTGGICRVYSTPNGMRDTAYYRIMESKLWTHFHWPSWIAPDWTKDREKELLDFYGGKDTPGWQHEVAGEHGKPSYGAFDTEHVIRAMVKIGDYRKRTITGEDIKDCEDEEAIRTRIETILRLGSATQRPQGSQRGILGTACYWLGGDLGYTSDPTELLLLEEDPETETLTLILRIHAEHVAYPVISEIIALIDRLYSPQGIGVDRGGNGMSVVQELLGLDKYKDLYLNGRLVGYDFGGSIAVGEDKTGKPIKKRIKEHMTALINEALNARKLKLPKSDTEIEDHLCTFSACLRGSFLRGNTENLMKEEKKCLRQCVDRLIMFTLSPDYLIKDSSAVSNC